MKQKFLTAGILFLILPIARNAKAEDQPMNIHQGNFLTGGSASVSRGWFGDDSNTSISLDAPVQYFVIDRLAVGGVFSIDHYSSSFMGYSSTSIGVGPAATYYFLIQDRLGFYASQSLTYLHSSSNDPYNGNNDSSSLESVSRLGVNYFITPSAAFGPALSYSHVFSSNDKSNYLDLFFAFSVYL